MGRQQTGGSKRSAGGGDGGGGGGGNCGGPGVCVPLRAGGQQHTARKQGDKAADEQRKVGGWGRCFCYRVLRREWQADPAQTHARSERSMLRGAQGERPLAPPPLLRASREPGVSQTAMTVFGNKGKKRGRAAWSATSGATDSGDSDSADGGGSGDERSGSSSRPKKRFIWPEVCSAGLCCAALCCAVLAGCAFGVLWHTAVCLLLCLDFCRHFCTTPRSLKGWADTGAAVSTPWTSAWALRR